MGRAPASAKSRAQEFSNRPTTIGSTAAQSSPARGQDRRIVRHRRSETGARRRPAETARRSFRAASHPV